MLPLARCRHVGVKSRPLYNVPWHASNVCGASRLQVLPCQGSQWAFNAGACDHSLSAAKKPRGLHGNSTAKWARGPEWLISSAYDLGAPSCRCWPLVQKVHASLHRAVVCAVRAIMCCYVLNMLQDSQCANIPRMDPSTCCLGLHGHLGHLLLCCSRLWSYHWSPHSSLEPRSCRCVHTGWCVIHLHTALLRIPWKPLR